MAAPKTSSKSEPAPEPAEEEEAPRTDAPGGVSWADHINRDRSKDPE